MEGSVPNNPSPDPIDVHRSFVSMRKGDRLLDIGCGSGGFLYRLESPERETIGIEPWEKQAKLAKARLKDSDIILGRMENLPFSSNSFDYINLSYVLEHVEDQEMSLSEIARTLKPGGRFVILSPNSVSPLGLSTMAVPLRIRNMLLMRWGMWTPGEFTFGDETVHYGLCSVRKLDRFLAGMNMRRINLVRINVPFFPERRTGILLHMAGMFERICAALYRTPRLSWFAKTFGASYEKTSSPTVRRTWFDQFLLSFN
jgi:SAM-dependent methyltransferase